MDFPIDVFQFSYQKEQSKEHDHQYWVANTGQHFEYKPLISAKKSTLQLIDQPNRSAFDQYQKRC